MAKQMDNKTGGVPEKMPERRHVTNPVFLKVGKWRNWFNEYQRKIIIAGAINNCIHEEKLSLAGYLITDLNVCLVLIADKRHINKVLHLFYEEVKKEIRKYRDDAEIPGAKFYNDDDRVIPMMHISGLFKQYPLNNDHLIKLITGRRVELGYYDPHLAWLKNMVANERFCSAVDYSGAKGPVMVRLLYNDDLKETISDAE